MPGVAERPRALLWRGRQNAKAAGVTLRLVWDRGRYPDRLMLGLPRLLVSWRFASFGRPSPQPQTQGSLQGGQWDLVLFRDTRATLPVCL